MSNKDLNETGIIDETMLDTTEHDHDEALDQLSSKLLPPMLEQFDLRKPLGDGGSGSVFLAHDTHLDRDVAVKRLKSNYANSNQILLAEARMQAKLDHPNICKIYQVAESDSNEYFDYLVMQYIPGQSAQQWLNENTNKNDLTVVVNMMQKICDGLQTMHQQGIIHRDIKPANIMLQTKDDGSLHPFLVDFGLANDDKDIADLGQKAKSTGTPAFMSPEQWQGATLNSTSDVYNFGATFYHIITQLRPKPVNAGSHHKTQFDNPQWNNLPLDLQAIIKKCMAIEPQYRYPSAKEVNQELLRFLNNEPVLSINSKRYWYKKKLTKHKWPALLFSMICIWGISSLVWQHIEQQQHAKQSELITTFVSQAENLEANVRLSKMTPRHDISVEASQWQLQIDKLKTQLSSLDSDAYGAGYYALGRMHYALAQYEQALIHLQQSWDSGFEQPRVAYHLALSHGAIYQQQQAVINNISSNSARKDRLEQLNSKHKKPAIDYLQIGLKDSPFPAYTKALLHYYLGQLDIALETLPKNNDYPSWFYQHHLLRGDIYFAKTQALGPQSNNESFDNFGQKAINHYKTALNIGQSDMLLHLRLAEVYSLFLSKNLYNKPENLIQTFEHYYGETQDLVEQASEINPNSYKPFYAKGQLLLRKSDYIDQHAGKPLATHHQAIDTLKQALSQAPDNADVILSLARGYVQLAKLLLDRDMPVEETHTNATDMFAKVPTQNRDYFYFHSYARFLQTVAINKAETDKTNLNNGNLDARNTINQSFENTIDAYRRAIALKPQGLGAKVNLASIFRRWSKYLPPRSAKQKLNIAIAQYHNGLTEHPDHFVLNYYMGVSFVWLAKIKNQLLEANDEQIAKAYEYLGKAEVIQADHPFVQSQLASLKSNQALYQWQQGAEYESRIEEGLLIINRALQLNPNNEILIDNKDWLLLVDLKIKILNHKSNENLAGINVEHYKSDISNNNRTTLMLLLHNNLQSAIDQQSLDALFKSNRAKLATAIWYSSSGQFQLAEQYFESAKYNFPSLLWSFYRQHLLNWLIHLNDQQDSNNIKKTRQLQQRLTKTNQLLQQNYPALAN